MIARDRARMFPPLPAEEHEQLLARLRYPQGTTIFDYEVGNLFDAPGTLLLLEEWSGQMYFRLERDANRVLHYFQSSPGTGTRCASLPLEAVTGSRVLRFGLVWSPGETRLFVCDMADKQRRASAKGVPSHREYRVGEDGWIYTIGDAGFTVTNYSVARGERLALEPTAIQAWDATQRAVGLLVERDAVTADLEAVTANVATVMLVTGFESYTRRRFLELEDEGIPANFEKLAPTVFSRAERDKGLIGALKDMAAQESVTPVRMLVRQRRIDFQNFNRCRRAYRQAYELRFGLLDGITNRTLEDIRRAIDHRHHVVHVSPLLPVVNQLAHDEEPIWASKAYAIQAIRCFADFVKALHSATLAIRPPTTAWSYTAPAR